MTTTGESEEEKRKVTPLKDDDKPLPKKEVAGYPLNRLLKAPFRTPQPNETESKEYTRSKSVIFLIATAIILFLTGFLLLLAVDSLLVGFFVILLAGAAVIAAVFLPLE